MRNNLLPTTTESLKLKSENEKILPTFTIRIQYSPTSQFTSLIDYWSLGQQARQQILRALAA
jgi:hypothetical protein